MLCVKSAAVPGALSMESNQLPICRLLAYQTKPFGISFFPHRLGVLRKRFDRWRTNSKWFLMIFFLYRIFIASLFYRDPFLASQSMTARARRCPSKLMHLLDVTEIHRSNNRWERSAETDWEIIFHFSLDGLILTAATDSTVNSSEDSQRQVEVAKSGVSVRIKL